MTQHRTTARRVDASLSSSSMLWFFASRIKTPIRHTSTAFQKKIERGWLDPRAWSISKKIHPTLTLAPKFASKNEHFRLERLYPTPNTRCFFHHIWNNVEHSVIFSNKWPIWQGQMYVKSQSSFLDKEKCHSALFFQSSQLLSPSLLTFKHSKLAGKSRIK